MDTCDVLIVGGGPAGSSCAWQLRRHGLDVVVIDKAPFPRDKACAGWITPPILAALDLDVGAYAASRTFQPFTAFRVGLIDTGEINDIDYGEPVSYGIRRVEFDDYLLRRSGARLRLGEPVRTLERRGGRWIANGAVEAPMIVGGGGHRCPVGRALADGRGEGPVVQAQEIEYACDHGGPAEERPELYFSADLAAYGWCVRKGGYVNVGFGRLNAHDLRRETGAFLAFLAERRGVRGVPASGWRAHAYTLAIAPRQLVGDGVLLIGDAAGLAQAPSGEGIRPAIESGLLAAKAICAAGGEYAEERLAPYAAVVQRRLFPRPLARAVASAVRLALPDTMWRRAVTSPRLARRLLLDRWFLRRAIA